MANLTSLTFIHELLLTALFYWSLYIITCSSLIDWQDQDPDVRTGVTESCLSFHPPSLGCSLFWSFCLIFGLRLIRWDQMGLISPVRLIKWVWACGQFHIGSLYKGKATHLLTVYRTNLEKCRNPQNYIIYIGRKKKKKNLEILFIKQNK